MTVYSWREEIIEENNKIKRFLNGYRSFLDKDYYEELQEAVNNIDALAKGGVEIEELDRTVKGKLKWFKCT